MRLKDILPSEMLEADDQQIERQHEWNDRCQRVDRHGDLDRIIH